LVGIKRKYGGKIPQKKKTLQPFPSPSPSTIIMHKTHPSLLEPIFNSPEICNISQNNPTQQLIHFLPTNFLHNINHNNISSEQQRQQMRHSNTDGNRRNSRSHLNMLL
jgi:hypothetical protein